MLEQVAENVWSTPSPLVIFGVLQMNTRMTIIRLSDGTIWLHSLVPYNEELCEEIERIGKISYLVAPNCLHHLFVGEWMKRFPEAKSYAARGLDKKRSDLSFSHLLTEDFKAAWTEEISYVNLQGIPIVNECVFFHKASSTLIITDLFEFMPNATGFTKFYAKVWFNGFYNRLRTPFIFKATIKDKPIFRASLEIIKQWNVKQVALCHHTIITDNAQEQVNKALAEL